MTIPRTPSSDDDKSANRSHGSSCVSRTSVPGTASVHSHAPPPSGKGNFHTTTRGRLLAGPGRGSLFDPDEDRGQGFVVSEGGLIRVPTETVVEAVSGSTGHRYRGAASGPRLAPVPTCTRNARPLADHPSRSQTIMISTSTTKTTVQTCQFAVARSERRSLTAMVILLGRARVSGVSMPVMMMILTRRRSSAQRASTSRPPSLATRHASRHRHRRSEHRSLPCGGPFVMGCSPGGVADLFFGRVLVRANVRGQEVGAAPVTVQILGRT
jgi:hypothetical protein